MVWRRAGDKTLSEPIIAQVTDVYMRQSFNFDLHCRSTSITISQQIVCVCLLVLEIHYNDVIMGVMASQTTSLTIVYSTVYSVAYQSKHQSSASLAFVRGIHRGPVNSPHKWPVTRKMFPFDDVIMVRTWCVFRVWLRFSCVSSKKKIMNTRWQKFHYSAVIMRAMASQINDISIVYSTLCSGPDERKHQNSASLP